MCLSFLESKYSHALLTTDQLSNCSRIELNRWSKTITTHFFININNKEVVLISLNVIRCYSDMLRNSLWILVMVESACVCASLFVFRPFSLFSVKTLSHVNKLNQLLFFLSHMLTLTVSTFTCTNNICWSKWQWQQQKKITALMHTFSLPFNWFICLFVFLLLILFKGMKYGARTARKKERKKI